MEESIQSVHQNTNTVHHSSEVISKNTEEVARTTTTMRIYLPILLIVLVGVLAYPFFMLVKMQRKILQDFKVLIDRLKK
jgi:beta-lactamase regulating signal transducer with metallopeptidase domain